MAAQQGFKYEENAYEALKPFGFVPKDFVPAGAGHNQPDLYILKGKKKSGCELKITDASAGSLVLKYNPRTKKWYFDSKSMDDPEKAFIMDLAASVKLFAKINKEWKETPYKIDREFQTADYKKVIEKLPSQKRYERDRDTFSEINGDIQATDIESYYNTKDTYYINIGTHGFYLLGNTNPLGLSNSVPRFSSCASAKWRARVQYKGSGNYQFTFEMSFKMRSKSPYNIAPITRSSVEILKNQIKLPI